MGEETRSLLPNAPSAGPLSPKQVLTPTFKIYLAGPDVFVPEPIDRGIFLKSKCAKYNLIGLFPLDNALGNDPNTNAPYVPRSNAFATAIRTANMELIKSCDGILANMTPFRGASMDVGTAYEMGVGEALGKVVVGYTMDGGEPYVDKIRRWAAPLGGVQEDGGHLKDMHGMTVEDFLTEDGQRGLVDNLMMTCGGIERLCVSEEDGIKALAEILREKHEKKVEK